MVVHTRNDLIRLALDPETILSVALYGHEAPHPTREVMQLAIGLRGLVNVVDDHAIHKEVKDILDTLEAISITRGLAEFLGEPEESVHLLPSFLLLALREGYVSPKEISDVSLDV